jgi:hypothetical protein
MAKRISSEAREELVEVLRSRYRDMPKEGKARILDEFVAVSGYHRKHAIRLLSGSGSIGYPLATSSGTCGNRRVYDEAVKEALIVTWEAADRICGKRLKAILPELVKAMERHGHLQLDAEVRKRLLAASAATIDRLLAPIRSKARPRKRRRKPSKARAQIKVRTFAEWGDPAPGYFEVDLVAHCGGSMAGSFIHTLAATDVCTGWIECFPLLAREQTIVVEALDILFRRQVPVPVLGIDTDNDSAFINDTLLGFCTTHGIEFTRSRAYRSNDQAWVEQKNGAVVRRMVGYKRFSGIVAGQALAHLFQATRLYVNYFQPSFKLLGKERHGAKVKRTYDKPATPCERLLRHPAIDDETKATLRVKREQLNPVELLHRIRNGQTALAALASTESATDGPGRKTLDQFLSQLPRLWRSGEVRPTHRAKPVKPRHWRPRKDPFEGVWLDVLLWLQEDPDAVANELFKRLQQENPGRFCDGQLRTLQRRVREWRQVMAKELIYACMDGGKADAPVSPGSAKANG